MGTGQTKTTIKNNAGFTLMEVMVSLSILAVLSLALSVLFISKQKNQIKQKNQAKVSAVDYGKQLVSRVSEFVVYEKGKAPSVAANQSSYDKMGYAVSRTGGVVPVTECGSCKKRLGVLVERLEAKGFYEATVIGIEKNDNSYSLFYKDVFLTGSLN